MSEARQRPLVFLSHASKDSEFVETRLKPELERSGLDLWYSRDDIEKGEEWRTALLSALERCDAMVVLMSPNAERRRYIDFEVNWGLEFRKDRVFPLLLAPCAPYRIHALLDALQHIEVDAADTAWRSALVHALSQVPAGAGRSQAARPDELSRPLDAALEQLHSASGDRETALLSTLVDAPFEAFAAAVRRAARGAGAASLPRALAARAATVPLEALVDEVLDMVSGTVRDRLVAVLERKRADLQSADIAERLAGVDRHVRIERGLGQGMLTTALLATEEASGAPRIVRVLRPEFARDPRWRAHFLASAQASLALRHPRIVTTRWLGKDSKQALYYVVRDQAEGNTLRETLASRRPTFEESVLVLEQVLRSLEQAEVYEHVPLHGALRPSNLFVSSRWRVTIGDACLPLPVEALQLSPAYQLRYVPPEAFRRSAEAAPLAGRAAFAFDAYSIGAVAHELFLGRPPRTGDTLLDLFAASERPWSLPPDVSRTAPPGVDEFLAPLLALDPGARPEDPASVLSMLARLKARRSGSPVPASAAARAPNPALDTMAVARIGSENMTFVGVPRSTAPTTAEPAPSAEPVAPAPSREPALASSADSIVGRWIQDRYRVDRMLGAGGMSNVYLAQDSRLERAVVVKIPHAALIGRGSPEERERFAREMRALTGIAHPHVLPVYDVALVGDVPCLIVPYAEGGSLADRLARGRDRPLPDAAASLPRWLPAVADALDYLHAQQLLHRDVKPSNILFDRDGRAFLADFGIVKAMTSPDELTASGVVPGSPAYMAPEAVESGRRLGPAYDQYGLATCAYVALAGRTPFATDGDGAEGAGVFRLLYAKTNQDAPDVRQLSPSLPAAVAEVLGRGLSRHPEQRFPSCTAFAHALLAASGAGAATSDLPRDAAEPDAARRPASWFRRLFRRG